MIVAKKAGSTSSDKDYFSESDLLTTEDNSRNAKNKILEKQESGSYAIAIALGVIFGILALILILLIAYHFYSKRAVTKIQSL